ncbi:DNA cytosine methyltransferase [Pseudomonas sp. B392_1p]|uniref:DNA cytosine methyltransferase n=1 Tax=Pseudomonas sp. B392_1p TaxID=3457507 RepID=UPI003FD0E039
MSVIQQPHALDFRTQYGLPLTEQDEEINVDLFAGGGGASTGLEMGLGRPVHIAINHNTAAISMHEANHPGALHLQTDVWAVDPVQTLAGRRIGWFHASPDCTHHSQAAGGQPRKKEIRDLSWVVIKWAGIASPRIISLENVKQIRSWGPLIAKRCKKTGRVITLDLIKCLRTGKTVNRIAAPGERVPRHEQFLVPDPKRKGSTWRRFLQQLESLGYVVEHRVLRACDYGAPTSRERLFLVARRDGQPITWPDPTHAAKPAKGQKLYRTAAECIDWSVPSKSIFGRKKPLATATMRRIAKGIQREVIEKARPFMIPGPAGEAAFMYQANGGFNTVFSKPMTAPMTTVTNTGSQQQLVTANLVHMRGNCDARAMDDPLHTISAGGQHHALATAFLSRQFGASVGQGLDEPAPTITAGGGGKSALVELMLTPDAEQGALRCAAFLMSYYGTDNLSSPGSPLPTITTKDRLALVTVWIGGDPYVIVDICLRMLQPHELYAAQGFPPNYIITHGHDGRRFTKSEQVHMCGNSVSPPPMAAIARANDPWRERMKRAA